jgi:hypothetical protein
VIHIPSSRRLFFPLKPPTNDRNAMARSKKGRTQLSLQQKKGDHRTFVDSDGMIGHVDRVSKKQAKKKIGANKKLNSAVMKKQAKRAEKIALIQLTQAFATKVGVSSSSSSSTDPIATAAGGNHDDTTTEFAREQASLRERMHAKKKIDGNTKRTGRRKNGGKGVVKVDLLDKSSSKNKAKIQDRDRRTTTTKTLQFAPPSFSLTKSTRQLLEETVRGLNGFGVSNNQTTPSSASSSFMAMANALPNVPPPPSLLMPPRPPPNTPILGKNPFARLHQEEDDDDNAPVVPTPAFAFQPARFTVAMAAAAVADAAAPDVDPDL